MDILRRLRRRGRGKPPLPKQGFDLSPHDFWGKKKKNTYRYFTGGYTQHSWAEFFTLEVLFNNIADLRKIVEVGGGNGTFTLFLALQAVCRNAHLASIELYSDIPEPTGGLLQDLGAEIWTCDCFTSETIERVANWVTGERCVFYLDNGDKPRELAVYSKVAKPGDFLVIHDWGTEYPTSAVDAAVSENDLEIFEPDFWSRFRNKQMAFRKTG